MLCPSIDTLAQYARGKLTGETQEHIASHLAQPCSTCRELVEWCGEVAARLETPLPQAPASVMERAFELFEENLLPGFIFAALVADSHAAGELRGVRGAASALRSGRRLRYRAVCGTSQESFDINIAVKPAREIDLFAVRGQLFLSAQQEEPAHGDTLVELFKSGHLVSSTSLNRLGEFIFASVTEGLYDLQIRLKRRVLVINLPVTLPARSDL